VDSVESELTKFFNSNYCLYPAISGLALSLLGMYLGTACISLGSTLLLVFGTPLFLIHLKDLRLQRVLLAYFALLLAVVLSVFLAEPYPFWKPVSKLRYFVCFFASTWFYYRDPGLRMRITRVALLLSFLVGILAPLQVLGILSLPQWLFGVEPNPVSGFEHFSQATGLLRHHTAFGLSVIYLFHILLSQILSSRTASERNFHLAGCGFCVVAIFCSFSRGAWLTWFFSTVFILFFYGDRRKKILTLSLMASLVAGALAFSPSFRDRLSSLSLSQNTDRLEMVRFAVDEFKKHPLVGHGFGRFSYELKKYPERKLRSGGHGHAHNIYLDMGAGSGLLGLLGLLWFFFLIGKKIVLSYRKSPRHSEDSTWFLGLLGIFVAFLFGGLFDEFLLWNQTLIPTLVILGSAFGSESSLPKLR